MADVAPTSGPVKQALWNKLKANSLINAAAVGGIHEGVNTSDKIKYPYVVYSLAYAPISRTWSSSTLVAGFDVIVRGTNPVEVSNLDALITAELDDSKLSVTGLHTLIMRREEELPLPPERNAEGKKVYQNGGTYAVWMDKNYLADPYDYD